MFSSGWSPDGHAARSVIMGKEGMCLVSAASGGVWQARPDAVLSGHSVLGSGLSLETSVWRECENPTMVLPMCWCVAAGQGSVLKHFPLERFMS